MTVDGSGVDRDEPSDQESRRAAMVTFLSAGLPSPLPTSVMVAALATARREVLMHQTRNEPLDSWLASEVRMRGVRGMRRC